jgi:hypothetical protein
MSRSPVPIVEADADASCRPRPAPNDVGMAVPVHVGDSEPVAAEDARVNHVLGPVGGVARVP